MHGRLLAFDPEVFLVPVDIIAGFWKHFITPHSANIPRLDITGIPQFWPITVALNTIADLAIFQMGLLVVRAASQWHDAQCKTQWCFHDCPLSPWVIVMRIWEYENMRFITLIPVSWKRSHCPFHNRSGVEEHIPWRRKWYFIRSGVWWSSRSGGLWARQEGMMPLIASVVTSGFLSPGASARQTQNCLLALSFNKSRRNFGVARRWRSWDVSLTACYDNNVSKPYLNGAWHDVAVSVF